MTNLHMAALFSSVVPVTLSAQFNDISDPTGGSATVGNTVTLTMGSGQTITFSISKTGGTLRYSKNGGAFTAASDAGTLAVANSDTLQFDFSTGASVETGTISMTVSDIVIGSFDFTGV